ncbi:hypothetical protein V1505DRAFT_375563 [Lipomyces doorenjongii]
MTISSPLYAILLLSNQFASIAATCSVYCFLVTLERQLKDSCPLCRQPKVLITVDGILIVVCYIFLRGQSATNRE